MVNSGKKEVDHTAFTESSGPNFEAAIICHNLKLNRYSQVMSLSQLPDDILLEVAQYLKRETLLALSQAFRKAYVLSFTSASWWYNDVPRSYLEQVGPLEQYEAAGLRKAAVLAHKTWLSLLNPQEKNRTRVRAPLDNNHYGDCIPPDTHWLFYATFSNEFNTTLVCQDLRNGAVIGRYALPDSRKIGVVTYVITATATGTESVQLALLCEGKGWLTPILDIVEVHFIQRKAKSETGAWVDANFKHLLQVKLPLHGPPPQNSSIRLPKWFFIQDGLVCWLQDAVQVLTDRAMVASLLTVVKFRSTAPGETEYKIGRWTTGNSVDLYALNAVVVDDFIIIALHSSYPRIVHISIDEVILNHFEASQMERTMTIAVKNKVFVLPNCQIDGNQFRFQLKFDKQGADTVNSTGSDLPVRLFSQPGNVSRILKFSLAVLGMSTRRGSNGSFRTYDVFMYITPPLHPQFLSASLHVRPGAAGPCYNTAEFGMFRGVVWFTTLDKRPILYMNENTVSRPNMRSNTGSIDLVDLEVGVACCFSDSIRLDDTNPRMEITWFRDLDSKFRE